MKVLPGEGVNTNHFFPHHRGNSNERFEFIMSTRLLWSKGIGLYADAARILRKKNYQVNFSLIGFFEENHPDSISHDDLKRWENEGLIRYLGFADDVRPYLQQADCMVFPSFYNEGVPRCLMEAASMELPAITSFNRGCKEVVLNNSNGYICNSNDPFDLADKMEKMINTSSEERLRMGRNGRQIVLKKFDICKIIEEYSNTLISAFRNNHGSNREYSRPAEDN
jgi:glycosyltransferase involved in cell wall biosynthesis